MIKDKRNIAVADDAVIEAELKEPIIETLGALHSDTFFEPVDDHAGPSEPSGQTWQTAKDE